MQDRAEARARREGRLTAASRQGEAEYSHTLNQAPSPRPSLQRSQYSPKSLPAAPSAPQPPRPTTPQPTTPSSHGSPIYSSTRAPSPIQPLEEAVLSPRLKPSVPAETTSMVWPPRPPVLRGERESNSSNALELSHMEAAPTESGTPDYTPTQPPSPSSVPDDIEDEHEGEDAVTALVEAKALGMDKARIYAAQQAALAGERDSEELPKLPPRRMRHPDLTSMPAWRMERAEGQAEPQGWNGKGKAPAWL